MQAHRTPFAYNECQIHVDQWEEDKLIQLLMGIYESYNTVRCIILMMTSLLNVIQAYLLLVQEEMQHQVTLESTKNFSIATVV